MEITSANTSDYDINVWIAKGVGFVSTIGVIVRVSNVPPQQPVNTVNSSTSVNLATNPIASPVIVSYTPTKRFHDVIA